MRQDNRALKLSIVVLTTALFLSGCCSSKCKPDPLPNQQIRAAQVEQARNEMLLSEQYAELRLLLDKVSRKEISEEDKQQRQQEHCDRFNQESIRNRFCAQQTDEYANQCSCCQDHDCGAGCGKLKERFVDSCEAELWQVLQGNYPECKALPLIHKSQ